MKVAVIGAGFSGLSAAAYLAKDGHEVHVLEKNDSLGGRARQFSTPNGYTFDMGPSWYWMPDIIENFFRDFGYSTSDFYELRPLDPQFEMEFAYNSLQVPFSYPALKSLFEKTEAGAGERLDKFMKAARYKYQTGMQNFVQRPAHSWTEFLRPSLGIKALQLDLLTDFRSYVKKYFTHPQLRALMEFPVIFLGAPPERIPALYSLMNYGGYVLGTHYPMGGFYEVVKAMHTVGENVGVRYRLNAEVKAINTENNKVTSLIINKEKEHFDAVIASSDYAHTETLLPPAYRNYGEEYWKSRTFAPSCLIYYLGISERIPNLLHHTLFFESDMDEHIRSIYTTKQWPEDPLFYVCCPSKTDPSVAPEGKENLFLLLPLPLGLADDETLRENYLHKMLTRIEKKTGLQKLKNKIEYSRSYCISDFAQDYHAYGGNAYGLANTLQQTAFLKPKIRNKKLKNLYYTGQLTVPGPGVPPSLISGKIVAKELYHEKVF
jgi:phytoene desaturase